MATSIHSQLNCGYCSEPYCKAIMLECVHSFCRNCVELLIKEKCSENKIFCPTCQTSSTVSSKGVDEFARNIRLDNQVKVASMQSKEDFECQNCRRDEHEAVEFCIQCNRLLCKACVGNHEVGINYDNHERVSIEEFKSGNVKIKLPPGKCSMHDDELFKWYCSSHKSLLCETCRIEEHMKCDEVHGLKKAATNERADLGNDISLLEAAVDKLDASAKACENIKEKVETHQATVDQEIDTTIDKLKQILEDRRTVLKKKNTEIAQMKNKTLTDQLCEIEKLKNVLLFLQEQIHDATTEQSLEELLSVKEVIKKRSKEVQNCFNSMDWSAKENEALSISFKEDEIDTISQNVSSLGCFSDIPDPNKCSIVGISILEAFVGFKREFKIIFKNERNEFISSKAIFQYKLEQKDYEGIPKVDTTITPNDGMSTLTIIPNVSGEFILTIMIHDQPLKKFPIEIHVHEPRDYSALSTLTYTTNNLTSTGGKSITINDGHLYITTQDVVEVHKLGSSNGVPVVAHNKNLKNPFGVTIVDKDVYIVNTDSHEVRVYAKAGELIRLFGNNGSGNEEFSNPFGICSDDNRILVADYGNNRVQVFSRTETEDGHGIKEVFLQSISCNCPYAIAADPSGNIHIAQKSTNQVEVFFWNSETYQHVEQYNISGSPNGICIDAAGNKFITDTNGVIHVFDPAGKEIASRSDLGSVGGIAVDSNGTLYIAITDNSVFYEF